MAGKRCRHENARPEHLVRPDWLIVACVCPDCGFWLPLGSSNDEPDEVKAERALAEELAKHNLEFEGDALDEAYDITVDIFAQTDECNPNLRPANRPRSPIEMMVDRACGIERSTP